MSMPYSAIDKSLSRISVRRYWTLYYPLDYMKYKYCLKYYRQIQNIPSKSRIKSS